MDILRNYAASDSEEDGEIGANEEVHVPSVNLNLAPAVTATTAVLPTVALYDNKKELSYNPKYEELFKAEAGPSNPFKSQNQLAKKNMLTGYVEPTSINEFHFNNEMLNYNAKGSIGGRMHDNRSVISASGTGTAEVISKRAKRKRDNNFDSSDIESYKGKATEGYNFLGPWAKFVDEKTVAVPDPELQKEMDEIVRKRKLKSKAGLKAAEEEEQLIEETTTLHIKDDGDYQNRSFMDVPMYTGANLRADYCPDRCYLPTKQAHTYKSHTKPINAIRWFPKSAHMFLSCAMDNKVKLWDVYGNRKLIRTYAGHKMPVRDICFGNDGTEFVSASFDTYIKLWDTETGQVKQRFHTGHRAFCVKFNPDEDKPYAFLAGMQNKKIVQWDTRTGEIEQEYDRHLGPVNSITFFDQNRRFCTTSDDKSIRIWEWGIPVDTKLIQNAGMHSIPTMTKAPSERWICGQALDSRIVLFQLLDDKLRFTRKKAFKGHNVAGYSCAVDFAPDMGYVTCGDAEGKVFVWDWRTHKVVSRWKAHDNVCISVLWHPHEPSRLLSAGWDGLIKMWI